MQNLVIAALLRLIVPLYGLLNLFLISKGLNPLPFSGVVTFFGIVWGWWKNSIITRMAQKAQLYLDEMKNQE